MKSEKLDESKLQELIITFADYVENFYDEDDEPDVVYGIVDEQFNEFVNWAYDDFVINEREQEALKNDNDQETREKLKNEVVGAFLMILEAK